MQKIADKIKQLNPRRRNVAIVCIVLAIILILVVAQLFTSPQRSVAAYCETFRQEKVRLAKLPGDTWPSGVFNDAVGDAGELVTSFGKLESVAPEEIQNDTAVLKSVYQKIRKDPSQAVGASLSGSSADTSLGRWTDQYCED